MKLAHDERGAAAQVVGWGGTDNFSPTSSSVQSAAFPDGVTLIRFVATAECNVRFGANPTAVATDTRVLADTEYYVRVTPGEKMAAIGAADINITYCV